jgi:hypothetical protein
MKNISTAPTIQGEPVLNGGNGDTTPEYVTQCKPPSKIGCVQPQPTPLPKPTGLDVDNGGASSFELGFALLMTTLFKSLLK